MNPLDTYLQQVKERAEKADKNASKGLFITTCFKLNDDLEKYQSIWADYGFETGWDACNEETSRTDVPRLLAIIAEMKAALEYFADAQCECSIEERLSGHLVGCWKPEADETLRKALNGESSLAKCQEIAEGK